MFENLEGMSFLPDEQAEALFQIGEEDGEQGGGQDTPKDDNPDEKSKQKPAEEKTETVDPEHLFDDVDDPDNPESVGRDKDKEKQGIKETARPDKSTPPYSSLAKALKEDCSIFLSLEDSEIEGVKDGNDFEALIEKHIQAQFDERQRRIDEALNNGVEPSVIKQYENTLQQLDSITDEQLEAESDEAENLRRNILYRDYLNKRFTEERAKRAVDQAVKDGTDIEDAKEALESIKETIRSQYQSKLDEAKAEEEAVKKQRADQAKTLRKSLLEDKELFGDLEVDKATRQKALDAILKPVYQDPETGNRYTAIQMYERENSVEFLKKVGLIYAMTDGFKNLDGLVGKKVKKEVGKGMRALEETLNNTQRKADGTLDYVSGANDKESFLGFTLDLEP